MSYKLIKNCRLCGSSRLKKFLNFGEVPLGNNLSNTKIKSLKIKKYPLAVKICQKCNHFQLGHSVDPYELYAFNYTYLTGITKEFKKHFNEYSDWIINKIKLKKENKILDIGSNDGTCLKFFKNKGMHTLGVDPAKKPSIIANKKGIRTINEFFNSDTCRKIYKEFNQFDLVTSHNVLAHIEEIKETFFLIYKMVKHNGHFCFEVGYLKNVIERNHFDTIYHEHLDYHHANPLVLFLNFIGFSVIHISLNQIQGGTIRMLCRKNSKIVNSTNVERFLRNEKESILYDQDYLKRWNENIFFHSKKLKKIILNNISTEKKIFFYGAPTKSILFLKTLNLDNKYYGNIYEDNILKINKYIPNYGIKIVSSQKLTSDITILVLAWNFYNEIYEKIKRKKIKCKLINPKNLKVDILN